VILGTISSRHTPTTIASDVPGADSKSAPWYIHHAKWLASNAAAVSTMQTSLEADRSAISNDTTLQHTTAAFGGSKLPKKVKLEQAQQLLIDRQLLAHSLAHDGFAAARAAALRQHYKQLQTVAADTAAEESIMSELQQQQQQGSQPFGVASRGFLVVGGSRTHLGNAYILLRMLREHLHCRLPVEVVYYGPQVGEHCSMQARNTIFCANRGRRLSLTDEGRLTPFSKEVLNTVPWQVLCGRVGS
jgi:hypothetical protein